MSGFFLHLTAACVIVTAIIFSPYLAMVGFLPLGYFWEKTQHRYVWSVVDGKLHREKTGWFGWITKHRLTEAAGWPAGAIIAVGIWAIRMALK